MNTLKSWEGFETCEVLNHIYVYILFSTTTFGGTKFA